MKKTIYLDYAAATPLDEGVQAAMKPFFSGQFHNPSATYLAGREAKQALDAARAEVAGLLGAKKSEIIFTSGATEANNLAIQGVMGSHKDGEALISAIEHDSVSEPAGLFRHKSIPVLQSGIIDIAKLRRLITDDTVLISLMLVNNELGSIQPLKSVAQIVAEVNAERRKRKNAYPIYLHSDAAQAGNYLDLQVARLGVDLLSLNGGKLYGPKQSGVLFVKSGTRLKPLLLGGGQELGLRSGTENLPGCVGFAKALALAQSSRAKRSKELTDLRDFFAILLQKNLKTVVINGSPKQQSPHLLSVTFLGTDNERLMMELDERGIQCAVGSACSAGSDEPSPVLSAIGLSAPAIRSTLRFSLGRDTTKQDLRHVVDQLASLTGGPR